MSDNAVKPTPRDLGAAIFEVAPVKTATFVVAIMVGFVAKLCNFIDVSLVAALIALGTGVALYRQREKIQAVEAEKVRNRTGTADN